MVALAREHDRFLMEAMWTACHPVVRASCRRAAPRAGSATPRQLHADLGFVVDRPPDDRMLDPALGAGALLDMGIYPLTFAHLVLGRGRRRWRPPPCSTRRGVDLDVAIAGALRRRRGLGADRVDDLGLAAHGHDRDRPRPDRPARAFHHPPYVRVDPARAASRERIEGDEPAARAPGSATRRSRSPAASPRGCARARWCRTRRRCR